MKMPTQLRFVRYDAPMHGADLYFVPTHHAMYRDDAQVYSH